MHQHKFGFEKLVVWQKAREFVAMIYTLTDCFPEREKFGLTNQIRRASVSVPANIAEGSSRRSKKEQAHYSQMAYGSLLEVLSHLYIASDLNFLPKDEFDKVKSRIYEISAMINALSKYQSE